MKDRIKTIRKTAGLSQTKFGESLGITLSAVQKWEMGLNVPDSSSVKLICERYGVREEWLRDGVEPMFGDRSREEALGAEVARLMSDAPDSFKAALISTLLRYDPDGPEWAVLEAIYKAVAAEMEKDPE